MKFLAVCECCDAVLSEFEVPPRPSTDIPPALTGTAAADIIESDSQLVIFFKTLCDDCRETFYGREATYYGGPVHH